MNLNKALFCEVNPIPVKEALNMMGWNAGAVRSPLCEMEPQHKELLRKELAAMKLIWNWSETNLKTEEQTMVRIILNGCNGAMGKC